MWLMQPVAQTTTCVFPCGSEGDLEVKKVTKAPKECIDIYIYFTFCRPAYRVGAHRGDGVI